MKTTIRLWLGLVIVGIGLLPVKAFDENEGGVTTPRAGDVFYRGEPIKVVWDASRLSGSAQVVVLLRSGPVFHAGGILRVMYFGPNTGNCIYYVPMDEAVETINWHIEIWSTDAYDFRSCNSTPFEVRFRQFRPPAPIIGGGGGGNVLLQQELVDITHLVTGSTVCVLPDGSGTRIVFVVMSSRPEDFRISYAPAGTENWKSAVQGPYFFGDRPMFMFPIDTTSDVRFRIFKVGRD